MYHHQVGQDSTSTGFSSSKSNVSHRGPLPKEAQCYYAGLPSDPHLVGRSSTTPWEEPTGRWAYYRPKVLGTVGRHAIKDVWEGNLSCQVIQHLDSREVAWTSIDVVRIGEVEESFHPVVLWIGVRPASLSTEDGTEVACSCKEILVRSGIVDVDVEIRASSVTFLGGPKLLATVPTSNPTVDVRNPLTPTLGLPISGKLTPWTEGTGGLYIAEGGGSKRVFLVTARHVVFEPGKDDNNTFEHEPSSPPGHEVILLSDAAFKKYLKSIKYEIRGKEFTIEHQESRVAAAEDASDDKAKRKREYAGYKLAEAKRAIEALKAFYEDVLECWKFPEDRVLGKVIYSPPIELGFGTEKCTQDFAVVDIDPCKIDGTNFKGNVVALSTENTEICKLVRMMSPKGYGGDHAFEYPLDHLLRLKGTIPYQDMFHPPALDKDGKPCLMVLKHGNATGLTVGRANDVRSCVRSYCKDDTTDFSMEWAILPFDNQHRFFSELGDSGAVVADGRGRIGGIIIGGAGWGPEKDITYAMTIDSLMQAIRDKFPEAHLNPDLRA